ncbi:SART-1 family-domain-containing protein [Mycena amicta]|nr:SART-1 family-domain-containing protein [Mycena amicta]
MSMVESISLEETNRIRVSIGLKPLVEDGAPADNKEKQAEENYAKRRETEAKERDSKNTQERLAKIKNRRELNASLKGATLGAADGDEDTLKWVKKSKKREKELAKKRQEELANMDQMFQAEYTERDLEGLKVSHDFEDLDEGDARILTLKDSRILDNEEDELQNVEMAEAERTKKNNELKIKKRDYSGYDDEEFTPGQEGMKRSVLSKYDEDINGAGETGFRLGSSTQQSRAVKMEEQKHLAAAAVNKSLLSIDYTKSFLDTDYLQEGDVGFKKPKKKKRASRRIPEGETAPDDQMDVDEKPVVPRERNLDTNFVDDDELQAALARSRKAKLHKANKMTPEQLAQKLVEQRAKEEEEAREVIMIEDDEHAGDPEGLTFDDTSEFIRAVGNTSIAVQPERREPVAKRESKAASESRDVSMAPGDEAIEELEAGEVVMKEEDNLMKTVEAEQADSKADDAFIGTASEQTEKWQSRGQAKDQATREMMNRQREQAEIRETVDLFKNYKPDVNLVYYDEYGRPLTPKETWKALSHRFHGKGSGKMKTEKRLKRIHEEQKQAAMSSGDTPLSMTKAFQMRQEKTGQAHMVLSVGNRGTVPQAAEFLDAHPLSKTSKSTGAESKGKKKKESRDTPAAAEAGLHDSSASPVPSGLNSNGSPAPKPGFSRISSAVDAPALLSSESAERSKVTIGFGTKRKATEEAQGSPASKRR